MPAFDSITNRLRAINIKDPKVLSVIAFACIVAAGLLAYVAVQKPIPTKQPASAADSVHVSITKDGFVPATLSIQKGTKVIWTNNDSRTHQIQANPHPTGDSLPALKSEILNNKQTYEYTFTSSGTVSYHDHLIPTANGTIEVK